MTIRKLIGQSGEERLIICHSFRALRLYLFCVYSAMPLIPAVLPFIVEVFLLKKTAC